MTHEPHDITTVSIRALPPNPPECRTLQDYQADLKRRFGRVPSWTELAARENRACISRGGHVVTFTDEGRAKIAAVRKAEGERTLATILAAMTAPMTRADIAHKTGIAESTVHKVLCRALEVGKVFRGTTHRTAIWERRKEAAE